MVNGVVFKKTFSYAGFKQQPKKFLNPNRSVLSYHLHRASGRWCLLCFLDTTNLSTHSRWSGSNGTSSMEIQQATRNTTGMCACQRCVELDDVQVHGALSDIGIWMNGSVLNAPWLQSAKRRVLANNPIICSDGFFFLSFSPLVTFGI